jgi:phospholipase C
MRAAVLRVVIATTTVLGASVASVAPSLTATGAPTSVVMPATQAAAPPASPPHQARTPIHHYVTVLQENHSFDNYFGSFPGADGIPPHTCVPVDPSASAPRPCVAPFPLEGKAAPRLSFNHDVLTASVDGGKLDGFVAAQSVGGVAEGGAMGTYDASTLTYYWKLAERYALFDHFFSSSSGGTLWNHLAWMTGSAAGLPDERIPQNGLDAPTIFDQLQSAGVSWKIYVENYDPKVTIGSTRDLNRVQLARVPVLAMPRFVEDPALMAHVVPLTDYYRDVASGHLPAVAYVVPAGSSEHPPSPPRSGQMMTSRLVGALERSAAWPSSAFLISYDDAGGWYDHIAPPAPGMGLRVPAILVSPYTSVGTVDHRQFETASIPQFIQDNWGLANTVGPRPTSARLRSAFDFSAQPRAAEAIPLVPSPPAPTLPGRGLVFPLYGGALALATLAFAVAVLFERLRSSFERRRGDLA